MDHPKRSLLKAVSWRFFGCISTIVIIYFYTRDIKEAVKVGVGIDLIKMLLYYLHERFWNKVRFGRAKQDYQI